MNTLAVSIVNLSKTIGKKSILNNINLEIEEGNFVCILGPSGCGKTTLLKLIAGFESPDKGKIYLKGQDVTSAPVEKRDFGIVFQNYALFPNLTVFENIAFGLKAAGYTKKEIKEKVSKLLVFAKLTEHEKKYPNQLSGGQQQRVALIRAIALSPSLLLLDEPLSALDAKVRLQLRTDLKKIQKELNITAVMVTHDQGEALALSDRIIILNNGQIEQIGSPQQIYDHPTNLYTASFIGKLNALKISNFGDNWAECQSYRFYFDEKQLKNKIDKNSVLCIRPEQVLLESDINDNNLIGTVKQIVFNGSMLNLSVEIENGLSTIEIVQNRSYRDMPIELGQKIKCRFPPESVFIVNH